MIDVIFCEYNLLTYTQLQFCAFMCYIFVGLVWSVKLPGIVGKNIDSDSTTLSIALTTTTSPSDSYASSSLASTTSTAYPASWIPSSWSSSTAASLGNIVRESSSNPDLAMDFQVNQNQEPVSKSNVDYVFVDTADLFPEGKF